MSLILEALRKLEREKRSSEPGFLVLGPTSWPSATRGARGAVLALIVSLALLATALGVVAWRNASRATSENRLAAAVPAPPPVADAPAAAAVAVTPVPTARGVVPLAPASPPLQIPVATPTPASPTVTAERAPTAHVSEPAIPTASEMPAPSPAAPQPRFRLQAISVRDGKPVAVLNDRMVYEGESFDGVSVVRIGEAEVELEIDGRRVVVGF